MISALASEVRFRSCECGSFPWPNGSTSLHLMISASIEGIDPYTPQDVRTRMTSRGDEYTLIFSDEFATAGRIFSQGNGPLDVAKLNPHSFPPLFLDGDEFWFAVDDESYDSRQITTSEGNLAIHIGQASPDDGRQVTGLLRSRSPFCLADGGYVDIGVTLPHTGLPSRLFVSLLVFALSSDVL